MKIKSSLVVLNYKYKLNFGGLEGFAAPVMQCLNLKLPGFVL